MQIKIPAPVFYASLLGSIGGGGILLRDYLTSPKIEENKNGEEKEVDNIEGKVVIITGANSGIGRVTAFELAKRKAKVIMACRDIEKCEKEREDIVLQTLNPYVYCRKCDLASQDSIRKFSERFKKENDRLDVLINNAAVMRCPYSKSEDGIELQLAVNHMGPFLLTHLLLDVMKKSSPSRIVNVSCGYYSAGKINKEDLNSEQAYDEVEAFTQSKLANVSFTMELHKKLRETGVTVNAVDPGFSDTNLNRHMEGFATSLGQFVLSPFLYLVTRTPEQAAKVVVYLSTSPQLEKVSGKYFGEKGGIGPVSRLAGDPRIGKWLWLTSEKWTRLDTTSTTVKKN